MRKVVILLSILFLVFIIPFATAINKTVEDAAKDCIIDKANENDCANFGLEDKIFSLLSVNKCENELLDDAQGGECFGLTSCTLKTTSQAILALSESNTDTDAHVSWLLNQTMTATGLEWLIQIESSEATTCDLFDSNDNTYQFFIGEDKKISGGLASSSACLSVDSTGYWLEINPSCYDQDFDISCDKAFLTSSLFKKKTSSTINVLNNAEQSSAGGTNVVEKIDSLCFKSGSACDYEGTLWATAVLNRLGEDISSYFPYLIAFEAENEDLLSESFLYLLTGEEDFRNDLILKQKREKYWQEGGDKYYDTALALLSLSNEDVEARDNSIKWLEETQGGDGCWDSGNIFHTGFLLFSLVGSPYGGGDDTETSVDCESAGNYCISDIECSEVNGDELSGYSCSGFSVCCNQNKLEKTCAELSGELCDLDTQECNGEEDYTADGVEFGEICCLGTCQAIGPGTVDDTCIAAGYSCSDFCGSDKTVSYDYSCADYSQNCCVADTETKSKSIWWVWVLIILIALVAAAIVFRDKLKEFYLRYKTQGFRGPPSGGQPAGLRSSNLPPRRMPPRQTPPGRIPSRRPISPTRRANPARRGKSEIDDVLKKLKEMGK